MPQGKHAVREVGPGNPRPRRTPNIERPTPNAEVQPWLDPLSVWRLASWPLEFPSTEVPPKNRGPHAGGAEAPARVHGLGRTLRPAPAQIWGLAASPRQKTPAGQVPAGPTKSKGNGRRSIRDQAAKARPRSRHKLNRLASTRRPVAANRRFARSSRHPSTPATNYRSSPPSITCPLVWSSSGGGSRRRDSGSPLTRRVPLGSLRTLRTRTADRVTPRCSGTQKRLPSSWRRHGRQIHQTATCP